MAGLPLCGRMLRDGLRAAGVGVVAAELPGCNHVDYVWALGAPEAPVLARIVRFVEDPPVASPPAPPAAAIASAEASRTDGRAAFVVVRPATGAPLATLLWCAADEAERTLATRVAESLAPGRVAVAFCTVGSVAEVSAAWQQLRQRAAAFALPEPEFVGGTSRGGLWVTQTKLARGDGLRGRIVLGAPLGPRAIAATWPGADVPDVLAAVTAAGTPPELLLVYGDGDARALRDDATALALQLAARHVDVQLVELAARRQLRHWHAWARRTTCCCRCCARSCCREGGALRQRVAPLLCSWRSTRAKTSPDPTPARVPARQRWAYRRVGIAIRSAVWKAAGEHSARPERGLLRCRRTKI
jgi:hypothetical protein